MTDQFPDKIQSPTYPQYTNLALNEGLFDQLMSTVNHHLDKQYKAQRIKGPDYAKAYVGSLESALQNTTTYLLGTMLIDEDKAKSAAETSLLGKQELKIEGELAMIELEKEKLRFEIEQLYPLQKQKLEAEVANLAKQGELIDAQILKINAEISMLAAQETHLLKQADKIDKEIEFLTAKILTEQANTQAGVAATDSLIGRQMSLLAAQKLGFAGDIQGKMAKLHADYNAVWQSVQETNTIGDATLNLDSKGAIADAITTAGEIKGV